MFYLVAGFGWLVCLAVAILRLTAPPGGWRVGASVTAYVVMPLTVVTMLGQVDISPYGYNDHWAAWAGLLMVPAAALLAIWVALLDLVSLIRHLVGRARDARRHRDAQPAPPAPAD